MAEICATIARRRHEKVFEEMDAAFDRGVRLLEIRLDFPIQPRLQQILEHRRCSLIATARRVCDGGVWAGSEASRLTLLRHAIADGFDYVDLEQDIAEKVPRFGSEKRIVSLHDLRHVPGDIIDRHAAMARMDADVVKLACRATSPIDNFTMFELMASSTVPTVALCIGEYGVPSRILGPKFGAPFAFAALDPARIVAGGMLTVDELRDLYAYEQIDAGTEIQGVIGHPIGHSLSPLVHNLCFRELGLNKTYVPFLVPPKYLTPFLQGLQAAQVRGLSVTIPHKEEVARFATKTDSLTRRCGAANTVLVRDDGLRMANTDGPAALDALLQAMPEDPKTGKRSVVDRQVHLLGAGGAARAIAHALTDAGAAVVITNRTAERAQVLAREVGCRAMPWTERLARRCDIVINCTSLGMDPDVTGTPIPPSGLHEGMVAFDTVYNPENTAFIRAARHRGCRVVTGVEMFVRQAEAQFRLFNGVEPPVGLMATLVREELSPARNMLREVRLRAAKKA